MKHMLKYYIRGLHKNMWNFNFLSMNTILSILYYIFFILHIFYVTYYKLPIFVEKEINSCPREVALKFPMW